MLKKIIGAVFLSCLLYVGENSAMQKPNIVNNSTADIGIIACLDPAIQQKLSFGVNTKEATKALKKAGTKNYIYWLDRKDSSTYHITLDTIHKINGNFNNNDIDLYEEFIGNYINKAFELNKNAAKSKAKFYDANAYELRLFVHYDDGTTEQFKKTDIRDLLKSNKDISYANLVLKIGTYEQLKNDWEYVQNKIFKGGKFKDFTSTMKHELETHITIANLYKYGTDINEILNGKMQRKIGGSPINSPFKHGNKNEMQILVDTFEFANKDFKNIHIKIDCLQITQKSNQKIDVIKTFKF